MGKWNKDKLWDYMDRLHELLVYLEDTTKEDTQAYELIKDLIERWTTYEEGMWKSEVDMEFVERWVGRLKRHKKEYTDEQREYFLKQMLVEAKVKIKE